MKQLEQACLHFDERSATRGQFERITIDALNDTIRAIAMGEYQLSQDSRSAYPSDLAECPRRTSFPMITNFYEVLETEEDLKLQESLAYLMKILMTLMKVLWSKKRVPKIFITNG